MSATFSTHLSILHFLSQFEDTLFAILRELVTGESRFSEAIIPLKQKRLELDALIENFERARHAQRERLRSVGMQFYRRGGGCWKHRLRKVMVLLGV
jgi:hypothetical protein